MEDNYLRAVIGEHLSGVCFVMDYIQLQFDRSGLSAFNPLTVSAENRLWSQRDAGWADALRARIGRTVQNAHATDIELIIEFDDEAKFRVSLRSEDYRGPEAFMFKSRDGPLVVHQAT
jgi:hypothetical protein